MPKRNGLIVTNCCLFFRKQNVHIKYATNHIKTLNAPFEFGDPVFKYTHHIHTRRKKH